MVGLKNHTKGGEKAGRLVVCKVEQMAGMRVVTRVGLKAGWLAFVMVGKMVGKMVAMLVATLAVLMAPWMVARSVDSMAAS